MRKIVVASIVALGALGFAAAAQADGDCAGAAHKTASTAKPAVTAENATTAPQTPIPTKETPTQTATAKTEKGS